jgi:hypothetical protein
MPHNPAVDIAELIYTWHATERMRTLFICRAEVEYVIGRPDIIWPGRNSGSHYVGKHIIVLISSDRRRIITVKLRSATAYVHGVHTRTNPPMSDLAA